MKAVRLNEWDQPLQFEDLPQPAPADDEVLVRVHAASINPIDRITVLGYAKAWLTVPLTLGSDFAGEVVSAGSAVQHVKPGDTVYGMSRGTFAEYATVKAAGVAKKPNSLDIVHAAAVPLAGLTAWQLAFSLGQLKSGERVLIHGAAGAIGGFVVQLAKDHGAYVIGHAKADRADFVRQLGADEFVAADRQRFEDVVGTVDVVIDTVGGELVDRSYSVLKPGGRFVTSAAQIAPDAGKDRGIVATGIFTQPDAEQLAKLAEKIDSGKLTVFVNHTFPLQDFQTAIFYQAADRAAGKVIITVN